MFSESTVRKLKAERGAERPPKREVLLGNNNARAPTCEHRLLSPRDLSSQNTAKRDEGFIGRI